jgi:putative flavoprotein involved in K+ transport
MVKQEILAYLDGFARKTNGSVREGVEVLAVEREKDLFLVTTSAGRFLADAVFLATSLYGDPYRPRCAERVPDSVAQIYSAEYRNAAALPPGAVIVVGAGQSGAQIAEDLHLDGRTVHLGAKVRALLSRPRRGRLANRHRSVRDHGR